MFLRTHCERRLALGGAAVLLRDVREGSVRGHLCPSLHTDNNRGSNLGYNQMLDNYLNNLGYNQQLVITSWLLAAGYNQLVISFINSILMPLV